jgi:hypothetical protein
MGFEMFHPNASGLTFTTKAIDIGSQKREQQKQTRSDCLEARIRRKERGKDVEHGDNYGTKLRGEEGIMSLLR